MVRHAQGNGDTRIEILIILPELFFPFETLVKCLGLKGMQQNQCYSRIKKIINKATLEYSVLQAWFSSNKCENKCIPLTNFRTLHHHTTLIFSTSASTEAAANEHEDSL